mgnify:CR=1 FL=1
MKIEDFKKKNEEQKYVIDGGEQPPLLKYKKLEEIPWIRHCFTTREGGASKGIFAELNLSFTRGDEEAAVRENYRRVAKRMGTEVSHFVCSDQTHTTNVRVVTQEDAGAGVVRERGYTDVDGLITNEPGLVLSTFYADCVPLFFIDPVHRAIGLSHSGWKGTVGHIGQKTVWKMHEVYGSEPKDIVAAIGPSICQSCYEVSDDVAEAFRANFTADEAADILLDKGNGKYQLDLWKANEIVLLDAGVKKDHLEVTDVCTCCNPELLFSHRASHGQRGNLGAFLGLK